MEIYLWIKAAHVIAWSLWIATLVVIPLVSWLHATRNDPRDMRSLPALRRVYSALGTPAMLAALGLGLLLLQLRGFSIEPWLQVKLALVVALTGLHGIIAGRLNQLTADPAVSMPTWFVWAPLSAGLLFVFIVVLAVVKPFA